MYGATESAGGGDYSLQNFERSEERRQQFSKRRQQQREMSKKRIKEMQAERPVLDTILRVSPPKKKKDNTRTQSSKELPMTHNAPSRRSNQKQNNDDNHDDDDASQPLKSSSSPDGKHERSFLYRMLSPHSATWQAVAFRRFISLVILADLILFVLSTDEAFTYLSDQFFETAEGVTSSIFLLEYLGRLYTVTEKTKYRDMGPIRGRLAYMRTFGAIIDLVAALPFFVEIPTGWNLPTLTYLRFLRLFRILKSEDYVKALDAV